MPSLVIVALPAEDDYVNKISSEKVAHMTLLFLGDVGNVQNLSKILEFTEHASKGLKRFGLDVDRRGELGEDNADVLFFRKSKWGCYPDLVQFRSDLLKENNIRLAYDSAEQHEEWIPHLALGYPEAPAKEDNRDYPGISYVNFDRIAVWFKEFEGVEFPLANWDEDYVLMSDLGQDIVNEIIHVSEKPWGDYKKSDYTLEQWHNACLIHQHEGDPTSKSQCKLPVKTPGGALNRNGVHAAAAALAGARGGVNASSEEKAKAASALRRYYSQLGEEFPDSLSQSDIIEIGVDFLEHFGVKGMRWGHRKEQVTSAVNSRVPHLTDSQKSRAKKAAIGIGAASVVVGGAYVAYKIHQSGAHSISSLHDGSESIPTSRGKIISSNLLKNHWNTRSLSTSGTYRVGSKAGKAHSSQIFKELTDAARARKAQTDGAKQVRNLLRSGHGSSEVSNLNPRIVSEGKKHLQTLYTKWVDIQVHPMTFNILDGALNAVK